jgi:hypothetical protein
MSQPPRKGRTDDCVNCKHGSIGYSYCADEDGVLKPLQVIIQTRVSRAEVSRAEVSRADRVASR